MGTAEINVYSVEEALVVDMAKMISSISTRSSSLAWSPIARDVDSCILLTNHQVAQPSCTLGDASVPTLVPLDALHADGLVLVSRQVTHARGCAREYDCRQPRGKRA